MNELALYILDLVQNSVSAGATRVEITVRISREDDTLLIEIVDDGRGMSPEFVARVSSPFVTTRTTRKVGLGIPMIRQLCEMCGGSFSIESEEGRGTKLSLSFQLSHVDLPPMGDLAETVLALVIGSPEKPDFVLTYSAGGEPYVFDTAQIRQVLDGVPLNTPEVLSWMREDLNEGLGQQDSLS